MFLLQGTKFGQHVVGRADAIETEYDAITH